MSFLVNPLTQLRFPEQIVPNAATIAVGNLARVSTLLGPVTVKAPIVVDDTSCFAVLVAGSSAATVDGNGRSIAGAATVVLGAGSYVFVLDGGVWTEIIPERSFGQWQKFPILRTEDAGSGATPAVGFGTYADMMSIAAPGKGNRFVCSNTPGEWVFDGTLWRPIVNGQLCQAVPTIDTFATAVNLGTSTITDSNGRVLASFASLISGVQIRGRFKPAAAANSFSAECQADVYFPAIVTASAPSNSRNAIGVACRGSSSSRIVAVMVTEWSQYAPMIYISDWANETTRTNWWSVVAPMAGPMSVRTRIRTSGTNLVCEVSGNGVDWTSMTSIAMGTSVFDQVGYAGAAQTDVTAGTIYHWRDT